MSYTLIVINFVLCAIGIFSVAVERDLDFLIHISIPFLIFQVLGAALLSTGKYKLGYILYAIGCAFFFPLALIGIFGATKLKNARNEVEFEQRRNAEKMAATNKE